MMKQLTLKCTAGALALGGGLLAWWFFGLQPIHEHRAWSDRMKARLNSLYDRCPPDLDAATWEQVVQWTGNLHSNCGVQHTWVNREEKCPFLEELERRLQGPVDLGTIDWIWDEYARITEGGQLYSDKYRPTLPPIGDPHGRRERNRAGGQK
jgi:hypothetical protein